MGARWGAEDEGGGLWGGIGEGGAEASELWTGLSLVLPLVRAR